MILPWFRPTGDGITTYAYDLNSNNELDTERSGDVTNTYTYDDRGNTITKAISGDGGTTSYTYNDSNHLTEIEYSDSTKSTYQYDGNGARVKKVEADGTVTYFLYDGPNVIMELDSDGNRVVEYTHGPRGLVSQRRSDTSYYVACDHLGSVWNVVTLDANDTISATYTYTAFGNTTVSGSDNTGNPYKYVGALGYYADPSSGLMLLGARYYNPSVGRFVTRDPIGYAGGINLYGYVGNNPINIVDPNGALPLAVALCLAGLVGGAVTDIAVQIIQGRCCDWCELGCTGVCACLALLPGAIVKATLAALFGAAIGVGCFAACDAFCNNKFKPKPKPKPKPEPEPKPKPKCCERKK